MTCAKKQLFVADTLTMTFSTKIVLNLYCMLCGTVYIQISCIFSSVWEIWKSKDLRVKNIFLGWFCLLSHQGWWLVVPFKSCVEAASHHPGGHWSPGSEVWGRLVVGFLVHQRPSFWSFCSGARNVRNWAPIVFVGEVICRCWRDVDNNTAGGSMIQIRLGVSLNGKNFSFLAFGEITLGHRGIPQELVGCRWDWVVLSWADNGLMM